jgi:acyl-coenzyme A synthetase/AMP-(fatty) acid ligase
MKNDNLFYYHNNKLNYTYSKLIDDLNSAIFTSPVIKTKNYYEIFYNILLSLIYDTSIVLLDYDFSDRELKYLGLNNHDLKRKEKIIKQKIITNKSNLIDAISNSNAWQITLYTSGITGKPKKITHSFETITRSVKVSKYRRNDIWGFAYNPTHIAGLQVLFQGILNLNLIVNLFDRDRKNVFLMIEKFSITNISTTPTFYRMLLPIKKTYPMVKKLTFGGEKFDRNLAKTINQFFPEASILHIYASTEAGTIFSSKDDYFEVRKGFKVFKY